MPAGLNLKTRLTLWSLCFLALVLVGGGFFWYSARHQQLLERLDTELLSTARDFACPDNGIVPTLSEPRPDCQPLNQLSMRQGGQLAISLYTIEGEQLCGNTPPHIQLRQRPEQIRPATLAGISSYDTLSVGEAELRQLTYPILRDGKVSLQLLLASPLKPLQEQLSLFALLLVTASTMALICLAALQWVLLSRLLSPLKQLAEQFNGADENNLHQPCTLPTSAPAEFNLLVASYNSLTDRLNRSLQQTRQFSTDVTHELRTPLTVLRGETELALRKDKDKEELQKVLSSNLEEIDRMSHLIEDLLLLSKSEQGEAPLRMEALNLGNLLEELFSQAQILGEEKRIRIQMQAPDEQVSLPADGLRLRQLFLNLLSNAIKYTPEGGRITIAWSLKNGSAVVTITDTGIGIDSAHQEHIFDRFYRINKTSNRGDGGSGLGLSIVKWIVEAHGGSIRASSIPGQGSSFIVTLPLTHLRNNAEQDENAGC